MKITSLTTQPLRLPLKKPFVTARRRADALDNVLIALHTDDGRIGLGEAATVAAVTGETPTSVVEAAERYIAPALIGLNAREDLNEISRRVAAALYGNTAAKCAVECAAYDLFAQAYHAPLYRILGGPLTEASASQSSQSDLKRPASARSPELETDITVSANTGKEMIEDTLAALVDGFRLLKIKLGKSPETDADTLSALWREIKTHGLPLHPDIKLRIDANQGWDARQAIRILRRWENESIPIELIEQPVPAWDIDALATVTAQASTPVFADESVFSPQDTRRILEHRAADGINIKLAKTGGLSAALRIKALCDTYGADCMVGCMLESRLGVSAAAHFALACGIETVDLDGPLLLADDPFEGGLKFRNPIMALTQEPGIGLQYDLS